MPSTRVRSLSLPLDLIRQAERLAKLLYLGETPAVHMPGADVRMWRQLINCRGQVVAKRTRAKNAARALLRSSPEGSAAFVDADLRDVGKIVAEAGQVLDFSEPVAVTAIALLHYVPDGDDPYGIVARLMIALPSGSYLAISHGTHDTLASDRRMRMEQLWAASPVPSQIRSRPEIAVSTIEVHHVASRIGVKRCPRKSGMPVQDPADLPTAQDGISHSTGAAAPMHSPAIRNLVGVTEDKDVRNVKVARSLVCAPVVRVLDASRLPFVLDGQAFRPRIRTEEGQSLGESFLHLDL